MSQVQTSPAGDAGTTAALGTAPSPDGPGSVAVAGTPPSPSAVVSTPRRLRRLGTALVVLGVVFGVLAALTFVLMVTALGRASASTAQLIRVQQIQTNLLAADATATNAFLVGGLEPPAQRQAYDDAINAATTGITEAAEAEPADEQALSRLNEELVAYVALIEDARANNRQGFPVGAQYQRTASATLRADALPLLDNLVTANAQRAESQMGVWPIAILAVAGLGALAALVLAQVWLARRFRRRVNPGVVAATVVVLVTWVIGLIAVGATGAAVNGIKDGSFADVNAVATARIQGFNAKSNESLTLIARGSGAAFEKAWTESAAQVTTSLADSSPPLRTPWDAYAAVHRQIRTLDDSGQWDQAVRLATGTGEGSSNATFGAFDEQTSVFLDQVTTATAERARRFPGRVDHRRRAQPAGRTGGRRARPARRRGPAAGVPMSRANRSLTLRQAQGPVILILLVVLSGCSLLPYAEHAAAHSAAGLDAERGAGSDRSRV